MATRKDKTANRKAATQVKDRPFPEHPIYDDMFKDAKYRDLLRPWKKSVLITERPEFKEEVKVHDIAAARAARQGQGNGDAEPGKS